MIGDDDREYPSDASTDRKSTRLNSSHVSISYAVFCLKKKTQTLHRVARRVCIERSQAGFKSLKIAGGCVRHPICGTVLRPMFVGRKQPRQCGRVPGS